MCWLLGSGVSAMALSFVPLPVGTKQDPRNRQVPPNKSQLFHGEHSTGARRPPPPAAPTCRAPVRQEAGIQSAHAPPVLW